MNRPVIIPSAAAPLVTEAFEEMSRGVYSIDEVRKIFNKKGLKCSRSNFWNLLHNPIYYGKIFVPPYEDEPAELVPGKHDAIISEVLFYQVQEVLDGKKRKVISRVTKKDAFPLRGFLICPQCNRHLTGSASKGNGGKYFYYHCLNGCKERIKTKVVHDKIAEQLQMITANVGVIDYYEKIMLRSF